jgi:farnesyl-diphosphate farnesyltransferase
MDLGLTDEVYQDQILLYVSRTFALTIPQLPPALRTAVTSAYLLCRIADTVEDEPALSAAETQMFLQRFKAVVALREDPDALASALGRRLSASTLPKEIELVQNMARVIRITGRLEPAQRTAIERCVHLMCDGMPHFQRTASLRGLPTTRDMDDYCYYVAGVVGEMLTELFCAHSAEIARNRAALAERAVSFAQGLQMTNILKDVWEDRGRGACWLPQDLFSRYGVDLAKLAPENADARFAAGMRELVAIAHAHLRNALDFTLYIPGREAGIRRFCLWAIGLAVLTLRRIHANPGFRAGAEVKIPRSAVRATRLLTGIALGNDWLLRRLFRAAAHGLPLAPASQVRRSQPLRLEPGERGTRVADTNSAGKAAGNSAA